MSDVRERLRKHAELAVTYTLSDSRQLSRDALSALDEKDRRIAELVDELTNAEAVAKERYCAMQTRIEELEAALNYISSGRRHPTCPTCADSREVARAATAAGCVRHGPKG